MSAFIAYVTQPKALMIVMIVLMSFLELRAGYFSGFSRYLKTIRPAPYALITILSAAIVLCVTFMDEAILQAVRMVEQSNFIKLRIIDFGGYLGKFYGAWLILAAFYIAFFLFNKRTAASYFFSATLSSALSGLLAHIIKHLVQRARPYTEEGPYRFFDWQGLLENTRQYQSFPSGDVAIVAGAVGFLFLQLKNFPARWLLLVLPFLTGLSRVWNNKHWPSDTLFAIGVGFAAGYFIYSFRNFVQPPKQDAR